MAQESWRRHTSYPCFRGHCLTSITALLKKRRPIGRRFVHMELPITVTWDKTVSLYYWHEAQSLCKESFPPTLCCRKHDHRHGVCIGSLLSFDVPWQYSSDEIWYTGGKAVLCQANVLIQVNADSARWDHTCAQTQPSKNMESARPNHCFIITHVLI